MWNVFAIRDDSGKTVGYGTISPDLSASEARRRGAAGAQTRSCAKARGARTSSSRRSRTSCAIRSRRSPTRSSCSTCSGPQEPVLAGGARRDRPPAARHMVRLIDDLLDVEPHHQRQARAAPRARRARRGGRAGARDLAPARARPRVHRGAAGAAGLGRRRPGAPRAGVRPTCSTTPASTRRPAGRCASRPSATGASVRVRVRDNGDRHRRASTCRALFDMFSQVAPALERRARRPRHRPRAVARAGRDARRHDRGGERRRRARQRVHRHPAGARRGAPAPRSARRGRRALHRPAAPHPGGRRQRGQRRLARHAAARRRPHGRGRARRRSARSRPRPRSGPTRSCSTSACRA